MISSRFALAAIISALAGSVTAEFSVLVPGGDKLWWVDQSQNTLTWACSDSSAPAQFNVVIANSNTALLTAPLPIISSQDNTQCSKTITSDLVNFQAGTGYVVQLTNIFNVTDVYVSSQPFEIKAKGATYPDPSSTPTEGGGSSPTNTSGGSSPSNTAGGNSGTGGALKTSLSGLAALAAFAFGVTIA